MNRRCPMTPSRIDIALATPLCHRRRLERQGQHGVHFTCFQRMRYRAEDNMWVCECGKVDAGGDVAARRWEIAA